MADMIYIALSAKTSTTKSFLLIKSFGFDEHLGCLIIKRLAESCLEDWKSSLGYISPIYWHWRGLYYSWSVVHLRHCQVWSLIYLDTFRFLSKVLFDLLVIMHKPKEWSLESKIASWFQSKREAVVFEKGWFIFSFISWPVNDYEYMKNLCFEANSVDWDLFWVKYCWSELYSEDAVLVIRVWNSEDSEKKI